MNNISSISIQNIDASVHVRQVQIFITKLSRLRQLKNINFKFHIRYVKLEEIYKLEKIVNLVGSLLNLSLNISSNND